MRNKGQTLSSILRVLLLVGGVVGLSACAAERPMVPVQTGRIEPRVPGLATPADRAKMEAEYTALVTKLSKDPQLSDVKRLREVYVRTDRYQPYGADGFPPQPMFDAADAKRWADCRSLAEKHLERNYMDLNAHLGASICNAEDGRKTQAAHHDAMIRHLVEAILATGNGKSMATAFETYYTPELYAFLGLNRLQTVSQALSDEDGQWFDIMTVKDRETGKEFSLYFNITWQWAHNALGESPGETGAKEP